MNLYGYLDAIARNKPVNGPRFKHMLEAQGVSLEALGKLRHIKGDTYKVDVINGSLFNILQLQFKPPVNRVEAAVKGNSHRVGTTTSYLFAKRPNRELVAIACAPDIDYSQNHQFSDCADAVLIENSECFTYADDFLRAMGLENTKPAVVIWSQGKGITHSETLRFLANNFESVYYCPDYDLEGIRIFLTLKSALGNKVKFVLPDELLSHPQRYLPGASTIGASPPKSQEDLFTAHSLCVEAGLDDMANFFTKNLSFVEQEVFLNGMVKA